MGADGTVFVWDQKYSTDNGATWTACAGLPSGARVASDRVNPKKFYAFSGGTLYASTDGAATFTAATTGLSGSGRAAAVFGVEGEVWVSAGSNLYHSKNSGAGATKVTGPSQVYSVGFGMAAPGSSYPAVYIIGTVSSVSGVFRSTDQGATWLRVNDDQHQFGQMDNVAGDEDYYGRVYVTTQGRGIPYGQPGTPTGGSTGSTGGTTGASGGTTAGTGGSGGTRGGTTGSSGGATTGTGGTTSARGGTSAAGGGANGGTTTAAGGTTSVRGGTTAASGGTTAPSGGMTTATGGSTTAGGGSVSGGMTTASGGSTGAGGDTAVTAGGSAAASGGAFATGGDSSTVSTGGTMSAVGGTVPPKNNGGCSTVYAGHGSGWAAAWMLALLAAISLRRRRTGSGSQHY